MNNHEPLSNVNVRQAINLAIDRQQMNELVYHGLSSPLTGLFPSAMTQSHVSNIPSGPNIAEAKKLLAGTACASGGR